MIDNGGPAFPTDVPALLIPKEIPEEWRERMMVWLEKSNGLTKREWFAGMAMQSLLINQASMKEWSKVSWQEDEIAEVSFDVADAMIEEASNGPK